MGTLMEYVRRNKIDVDSALQERAIQSNKSFDLRYKKPPRGKSFFTTTIAAEIGKFRQDPDDPAWMTCALGCCTANLPEGPTPAGKQ
jgi:hypothetical protein